MTTLDYLKHRLGDKISQTINIENIHVINGKVTLVGKGECHETTEKAHTRAETVCFSTPFEP
jgi:hypothetical protein